MSIALNSIPDDDPSEPTFDSAATEWMDDLPRLADQGHVEELTKHGDVYVRPSSYPTLTIAH